MRDLVDVFNRESTIIEGLRISVRDDRKPKPCMYRAGDIEMWGRQDEVIECNKSSGFSSRYNNKYWKLREGLERLVRKRKFDAEQRMLLKLLCWMSTCLNEVGAKELKKKEKHKKPKRSKVLTRKELSSIVFRHTSLGYMGRNCSLSFIR